MTDKYPDYNSRRIRASGNYPQTSLDAYPGYPRVQATAPRIVCAKCKKTGKCIHPEINKPADLVCPHCGYDNYEDPENLTGQL